MMLPEVGGMVNDIGYVPSAWAMLRSDLEGYLLRESDESVGRCHIRLARYETKTGDMLGTIIETESVGIQDLDGFLRDRIELSIERNRHMNK
ncbi:MAG: hypothetical protein EHM35_05190 [Planctomycetaceae bacterium]|nr:MAG: hypothetical protein EHM35_05190 [Planctomycetaceae bacterium]